jgi:MFS family permease
VDGLEAVLADVLTAEPEESLPHAHREPSKGTLHLLRRRDFRLTYAAIATSELGYAFQYIALMWFALEVAGPAGVLIVRLADSVPALLFGLHGGLLADRLERRRTMIAADLFRGAVLIPVAIAGLAGDLPLWGLVLAAFLLTAATSYFDPAYGALLPALVGRAHVQEANALVRASADAINVGGWALAAALLIFTPLSVLFAINAATFFVSAALISRIHPRPTPSVAEGTAWAQVKEGMNALALLPVLAVAVAALGIAVTIESGTWMVGVPELVRSQLAHGPGGFSLVMVGYAAGSIAGGIYLARHTVRRKAYTSLLAWTLYLPAYLLMGLAGTLTVAILGALCAGIGQGSSIVLLNSAAQEQVPDRVLGRVMGLIGLVHRGAHATGLIFVSPLFAFFTPRPIFVAAALAGPLIGIGGAVSALVLSRRGAGAPARAVSRSPRS